MPNPEPATPPATDISLTAWIEASISGQGGYSAAILADLKAASATLAKVREIASRATPGLLIGLRCAADDSPAIAAMEIREAVTLLESLVALLSPPVSGQAETKEEPTSQATTGTAGKANP